MELYPFQKNAIDTMLAEPERHFCIAGTGAGKTSIALHWAKAQGKSKVLVVTPASKRDSEDWQKEADEWFGSWRGSLTAFDVISWQGLAKWWQDHRKQIADYAVVFDECLPADTKVKTDNGEKELADLNVGEKVLSYNHKNKTLEYKTITRVIKKLAPQKMYRLLLSNGTTIISTDNHPHYTQVGYKQAKDITTGDILYELHDMQKRDGLGTNVPEAETQLPKDWESVLFNGVPNEGNIEIRERSSTQTENKSLGRKTLLSYLWERNIGVGHDKKPSKLPICERESLLFNVLCKSERRGCENKGAGDQREERVATNMGVTPRVKGWQREIFKTTTPFMGEVERNRQRLDVRATSLTREMDKGIPNELQTRHRECLSQDRDRMRRGEPQFGQDKSERQEERKEIRGVRVESIEVLELGDIKQLGLYRDPDYVYCIDVEDNHNFFANGVLTHNCHSVKAGISSQRGTAFLKIAAHTDCWTGYTATPGDCWMDFYAYFAATDRITGKTAFKSRFCNIQTFKGFPEIVGYRETNTLKQWWKEISLSVDISEMLRQLPPETHKVITFKKPASYDKVLKTRMTEDGEFLDTPMSLCAHLRQLCSKSKLNYVADFVEGLGDRIVIFYNFIKEGEELQQAIEKALPKSKVWRIDGKTHDIPTEQTCGKRDVVLVQWQAGSMGLNLQFIQYWLSVSPNYSWTISTQARGRIKRIGQQKPMWFGYLECEHTIEENIYACLRNKQDFVESSWCEKNNI